MTIDLQPLDVERADYRSHLGYYTGQERLHSRLQARVLDAVAAARFDHTPADVLAALRRPERTATDLAALLSPAASEVADEVVAAASRATIERFGRRVRLFTPLYLANYCGNACTYCGFAAHRRIRRARLSSAAVEAELDAIAATGLDEVLLLTGESPKFSSVAYIADAVGAASARFGRVGVEVQPVNTDEYAALCAAGAASVSVYQETYDPVAYDLLHPGGRKRSYPYRFESQERALRAGMSGVGFGALLGLADWRRDALATVVHAAGVAAAYPGAEIGLSCPRLRPTGADPGLDAGGVTENVLFQILCAYRLCLPAASITVSTRESASFRDRCVGVVATKVSAGVSTEVGGHASGLDAGAGEAQDAQFEIADHRTVDELRHYLQARGFEVL